MKKVIQGEEKFQVHATEWVATPSRETYHLMYSSDGKNYTRWEDAVPAYETLVVNMAVSGMYYYFEGNNTNIEINYED